MLRSVALVILALFAVTTAEAAATVRISNHNDPAGDPTVMRYRLESPTWSASPFEFVLSDGADRSFGLDPGTYTAQALVPAGWVVGDIQCVGPRQTDFVIDVPNGRVTITHAARYEQTCAFTNRRVPQGGAPTPSPGVSPAPPPDEIPKVVLPRGPALLSVTARRGAAEATLRITRRSVIKGTLARQRGRIVGAERIVRKAGTRTIRVPLDRQRLRRMRQRGLERVMLTLRIAVTARRSGATHVFTHRVLVTL
jgi:hypothetical protein